MTARQAIGLLAQEGLVDRVQGSGSFIKRLKFTASHFGLTSLGAILREKEKLEVRILNTAVEDARGVQSCSSIISKKEKEIAREQFDPFGTTRI